MFSIWFFDKSITGFASFKSGGFVISNYGGGIKGGGLTSFISSVFEFVNLIGASTFATAITGTFTFIFVSSERLGG